MKKLNQSEWEIVKYALSIEQVEKIQKEGSLKMDKEDIIKTLEGNIKDIKEQVLSILEAIEDKDIREKLEKNGNSQIEENEKLIEKLQNDISNYEAYFIRGGK